MDKILFICEGAKAEKHFCNLIIDRYFIQRQKPKEFVAFGTNIYGLYDEMSRDYGLDVVSLIMNRAKARGDMYNFNKLYAGGFTEIYLIFDFDFQAPQYDYKKILEMTKFFDNETENGKLYINYPMIEAFKHFKELPDYNFNSYKVNRDDCLRYKELINSISAIVHFSDVTEDVLKIIIKQNLDKYAYLLNDNMNSYGLYRELFSQKRLLDFQVSNLESEGCIFVINTALFWGIDYFGKDKFDEYNELELSLVG